MFVLALFPWLKLSIDVISASFESAGYGSSMSDASLFAAINIVANKKIENKDLSLRERVNQDFSFGLPLHNPERNAV